MRSNYEPVTDAARLLAAFGVTLPVEPDVEAAPGDERAAFIVAGAGPQVGLLGEVRVGRLGLLPALAQPGAHAAQARECRVDTMKSNPTFRENWWAGRRCVVPVERLTAWSYASGRPEAWAIQHVDGEPLALAGLWNEGMGADGKKHLSFCVLTLDATGHAVYGRMSHPLALEARMPAILPADLRWPWLHGSLADAQRLLVPFAADALHAAPLEPADTAAPRRWSAEPDLFAEEWWRSALETPHRKPARPRAVTRVRSTDAPGPVTSDLFASAGAGDVHDTPARAATS